jgi:hypothetical protein
MRKTFILTLVLCVFAAIAYAQTGSTGTTGTSATTTTTTSTGTSTTAKKHTAAHHPTYKGTVASVDSANNSFTVHPAKGDDQTYKVNDKTKYLPKGKTWADVTQGAKVSGTYHNDGKDNWALLVHIWPAAASSSAPPKTGN